MATSQYKHWQWEELSQHQSFQKTHKEKIWKKHEICENCNCLMCQQIKIQGQLLESYIMITTSVLSYH